MDFYHSEDNNRLRHFVNWIVDIVVVIAFALFLVYAYGTQIVVAGHSMLPLFASGDVVLMDRLSYDFGKPDRFDIVVFQREDQKMNVKRIVGLPGETVQIKNDEIYINGEKLEEPAGLGRISLAGLAEKPMKLGEEEYFLLGDNRDSSEDSRFSNIGKVSGSQIKGKIWLRMLPLVKLELIRSK
ncbi:signal peptidase I [Lacrimispora xylanisolvens]|uniref:signal peptidase I n=1 Tax=Lacrimispora xylanisolvens TaxID=384636 RepID=UPI0024029EBF|nr:signal peptidase I [Paenibacillaceae bacterium]